jgi:hypothetical protein
MHRCPARLDRGRGAPRRCWLPTGCAPWCSPLYHLCRACQLPWAITTKSVPSCSKEAASADASLATRPPPGGRGSCAAKPALLLTQARANRRLPQHLSPLPSCLWHPGRGNGPASGRARCCSWGRARLDVVAELLLLVVVASLEQHGVVNAVRPWSALLRCLQLVAGVGGPLLPPAAGRGTRRRRRASRFFAWAQCDRSPTPGQPWAPRRGARRKAAGVQSSLHPCARTWRRPGSKRCPLGPPQPRAR